MTRLKVRNLTTERPLGDRIGLANRPWTRAWGLLGKNHLESGEGLLIDPCDSIHTWFMRLPLDVLFLDRDKQVVGAREAVPAWRMVFPVKGARQVLELPVGTIKASQTAVGHQLEVVPTTTPA